MDRPPADDPTIARQARKRLVGGKLLTALSASGFTGSLRQTRREKAATVSALNLFFGALIGANVGAFAGLKLIEYVMLVSTLAGSVMTLRILSMSERRGYKLRILLAYMLLVPSILFLLADRAAVEPEAIRNLGVTLAIWLALVVMTEFTPARDGDGPAVTAAEDD